MTLGTGKASTEQAVLNDAQITRDSAKKQAQLVLARTVLFDADGEPVTQVILAKTASTMTMSQATEDVGFALGYFHGMGFLVPSNDTMNPCCADVSKELMKVSGFLSGNKLGVDARVFTDLVSVLSNTLRAVTKGLIQAIDGAKYMARVIAQVKSCYEVIVIPSFIG